MRRIASVFVLALLTVAAAQAMTFDTPLANPAQEAQARQLFTELRCVVCEGQSLAESDAVFAQQMRGEIRRRLASGAAPDAIKQDFVAHYGAQILQRPPLAPSTWLLWALPMLCLAAAAWFLRPRSNGARP